MKPIGILLLLLLTSCSREYVQVIDRPIIFSNQRKELSLQYMEEHYGIVRDLPLINPVMIVIHWTAIPTLEESFAAFDPVTLPGSRSDISGAGDLNVSVQYLVDRDGTVYRLMPDTFMGRHVIGLNHCSIGIENVGGTDDTPLTDAQLTANINLVRQLYREYDIDYLIGHYEYTLFENHPLWKEKDTSYRTEKTDPGTDFMMRIREGVADLNFKPLPQPQ